MKFVKVNSNYFWDVRGALFLNFWQALSFKLGLPFGRVSR